jgi:hypothetical protein
MGSLDELTPRRLATWQAIRFGSQPDQADGCGRVSWISQKDNRELRVLRGFRPYRGEGIVSDDMSAADAYSFAGIVRIVRARGPAGT